MPKESLAKVSRRRLLGVLFIVIIVGFVSLSIAIYEKAFTDTDTITLLADHTGNQLILDSDVKIRGLIVGSVTDVGTVNRKNGQAPLARVTLSIDPAMMKNIPSNVTAEILPKTLFGEQYVSLVVPTDSSGRAKPAPPIRNNATIEPDRSVGALEAQNVLGDLLPLLQAVQPAELNSTLNAIATALRGKGPKLGETLTNFDKYLKIMNPHTAKLVDDLKKLGQVSLEYNNLAPDIFAVLRNLQTSARTIIEKRADLDHLLTVGASTSGVLQSFLNENRHRLIDVTGQSAKMYRLLRQYSPEYSCLLQGINKLQGLANQAIYNKEIHLSVTVDNTNIGKYKQGEEPRLLTHIGPHCFGLPNNPQPVNAQGKFQIPSQFRCINDGAALTSDPCGQSKTQSRNDSAINSPEENALVNSIISTTLHTTPDKVDGTATLLAAPLLRGNQVVIK